MTVIIDSGEFIPKDKDPSPHLVYHKVHEIKSAIINNDPIEENLHVIGVISNPCNFKRRYQLARQFMEEMKFEKNVILYVVELCYDNQKFQVTDSDNPRHLQVRGDTPLWHKENMINMGVNHLLPNNYKAFAWIDMDISFESPSWALDTLKILNGSRDIVQLFSHAIDEDHSGDTMSIFTSFGHQYAHNKKYKNKYDVNNYFHSGFAYAMTKKAYLQINGLLEISILGSGDFNMAMSWIGHGVKSINGNCSDNYKKSIKEFEDKSLGVRVSYIQGVIKHKFHGQKTKRFYNERWKILVDNKYDPYLHVEYRSDGLLVPTKECPQKLLDDINNYFKSRDEDEFTYN